MAVVILYLPLLLNLVQVFLMVFSFRLLKFLLLFNYELFFKLLLRFLNFAKVRFTQLFNVLVQFFGGGILLGGLLSKFTYHEDRFLASLQVLLALCLLARVLYLHKILLYVLMGDFCFFYLVQYVVVAGVLRRIFF